MLGGWVLDVPEPQTYSFPKLLLPEKVVAG